MRMIGLVSIKMLFISGSALAQWTTSGDHLYNSNKGNVGIGTTNPANRLQIGSNNPTGWGGNDLVLSNINGALAIHNDPAHTYLWGTKDIAIRPAGKMAIYTNTSGNVGIGTSTPSEKLDVTGVATFNNGAGYTKGNWRTAAIIQLNHTSNVSSEFVHNRDMRFLQYGDGGGFGAGISWNLAPQVNNTFTSGSYSVQQFLIYSDGRELTLLGGTTSYSASNQTVALSKVMTWSGSGNVGIGTSQTGSYKLAVEGKIACRSELRVFDPGVTFPDYVFDKNYNLRSLDEVKHYIQTYQHLPDVPSAQEIAQEGVELAKMNALLLKKIEELTLYLIQQQEEIEKLKKNDKK